MSHTILINGYKDGHIQNAMNNIFEIKKRLYQTAVLFVIMIALSACAAGTKKSVDNSADYRSAQSLPPLKKPDRESKVIVQDQGASPTILSENISSSDLEPPIADQPTNGAAGSTVEESIASQEAAQQNRALRQQELVESASTDLITATVVEARPGVSRLHVDAKFESAWSYLSQQLQSSSMTVFTRNKDAGRVDIGCSQLDEQLQTSKSGGWSVFRRDRRKLSDYCALKIGERRGATIVTLLDRQGDEVVGEFSAKIFNQLNSN